MICSDPFFLWASVQESPDHLVDISMHMASFHLYLPFYLKPLMVMAYLYLRMLPSGVILKQFSKTILWYLCYPWHLLRRIRHRFIGHRFHLVVKIRLVHLSCHSCYPQGTLWLVENHYQRLIFQEHLPILMPSQNSFNLLYRRQ